MKAQIRIESIVDVLIGPDVVLAFNISLALRESPLYDLHRTGTRWPNAGL